MGYSLKTRECVSPKEGVVSAAERGHLECNFFGPIILRCAEYHIQCDFSRTSRLPTRDDSPEGRAASLNAALVNFHLIEGFLVDEV